MGISNKMGQMVNNFQVGAKNASTSLLSWFLKVVTAFVVSLTLAMIGQEILAYGTFSFVFVLVSFMAILLKTMAAWSTGGVLIFDLICVLMALLLRMYILIAP